MLIKEITPLEILAVIFPVIWALYRYEVFNGNWRKIFSNFISGIIFVLQLFCLGWFFLVFLRGGIELFRISLQYAGISSSRNLQTILTILFILVNIIVNKLMSHWDLTVGNKEIRKSPIMFLSIFTNMILTALIFASGSLIIFLTAILLSGRIYEIIN